jgi:hypothetical protein
MPALLNEAHPNFGLSNPIASTTRNLALTTSVSSPSKFNNVMYTGIQPVDNYESNVAPFIPPKLEAFNPSPVSNPSEGCDVARRHWHTCPRCRRREFFMVVLEMIAYVLMGVLIIIATKTRGALE